MRTANARRKSLQKMFQQVTKAERVGPVNDQRHRLEDEWAVGVLGLVAGQVARKMAVPQFC